MKKATIITLVESAVLIALASALSMFAIYDAPLGGKVTILSMLPIMFISFRRGIKWGLASGFVYSVIQIILGIENFSIIPSTVGIVMSILFDYILPFTLLGFSGIFFSKNKIYSNIKSKIMPVFAGVFLACFLRFICHWISGGVIWYELTKEHAWNEMVFKYGAWTYSFIYNIAYMGPETALTLLASPIIIRMKDI